VIFIDNVDQLSPSYQANIFLLAQRITRIVESITIVSLREESYYAASVQKTFTAYSNKKFHIASPKFRELIRNRINYAIKLLNCSDKDIQIILSSGIEMDKEAIIDFLEIVNESIFQKNKNIARFIEAICFGNMRLALQMFTTFLISGVTEVDKMLNIYRREGSYYVAYHEFAKSIMLGDRKYYKEEQSPIKNVFDCSAEPNSSHFTALRILEILLNRRSEYNIEGKGYVEISQMLSVFEDVFDNRSDFVRVMNKLVSSQLIELNTRSIESINGASHARVTSAGWYYAQYLTHSFCYLDLVLQDTPINEKHIQKELKDAVLQVDNLIDRDNEKMLRMEVRFRRVENFIKYLQSDEEREQNKYNLQNNRLLHKKFIPEIKKEYEAQRDWIKKRLCENRERFVEDLIFESNENEYINDELED